MNISKRLRKYIDLKILFKSVAVATVFLLVLSLVSFGSRYDNIRQNVLRLHILANSDSAEDQSLKLRVRDAVLKETEIIFANCENEQQAVSAAKQNLGKIAAVADETIKENGYNYTVTASVCDMWFEDRVYDNFTLPAGMYEAVRVEIGEANGKNWWCVMFPGICLPTASDSNELSKSLSEKETDMCERPQKYTAKFKVVELFHRCQKGLKSFFGS